MLNSLKRIREQQSLSVEFVTTMLEIDDLKYVEYENGEKTIPNAILEKVIRLFGVEKNDIYPKEQKIDVTNIGLARAYNNFTDKDINAISKLINIRQKYNSKG